MAPESSRRRMPFEPGGKRASQPAEDNKKAAAKQSAAKSAAKKTAPAKKGAPARSAASVSQANGSKQSSARTTAAIPQAVSDRMLRRMLAFSGVPTGLGILTFFVSYYLVTNQVIELPSYFVLLVTLACFGLGVVGLTYGVLSASWDEDRPGSWLGLEDFRVNFGRITGAWGAKSER